MTCVNIPYGKGSIPCEVPEEALLGVLESGIKEYQPKGTPEELVEEAMAHPIGSPSLREMAKGKKNVVIIASDHTRPVPSRVIIPPMLREIREGNPDAEITILIATGCHRGTKKEEIIGKFGEEIAEREHIIVHDCDRSDMVRLGVLPSGQPLIVNKIAAQAELLVAEGFIEPHFFAGYSGGRKSVLPGVVAREVVLGNHNGAFIDDPHSRTGILAGNRIHEDMLYAAKTVGLSYIVNVVLNAEHEAIYAVAGDVEQAHAQGCAFLASHCKVALPGKNADELADIVITSNGGYPLDQNVYQAVKGMTAAEAAVKEGGVIIMASKCDDGSGGDVFYKTFRDNKDPAALIRSFVATPPSETLIDQWQSQIFARVLCRADVIFISEMEDDIVRDFHMIPAHSISEALVKAEELLSEKAHSGGGARPEEKHSITIIPDGVGVYL